MYIIVVLTQHNQTSLPIGGDTNFTSYVSLQLGESGLISLGWHYIYCICLYIYIYLYCIYLYVYIYIYVRYLYYNITYIIQYSIALPMLVCLWVVRTAWSCSWLCPQRKLLRFAKSCKTERTPEEGLGQNDLCWCETYRFLMNVQEILQYPFLLFGDPKCIESYSRKFWGDEFKASLKERPLALRRWLSRLSLWMS